MNNQKGFANIALVVLVVILAGVAGYFALVRKPEPVAQQTTPPPVATQTPTLQQPSPTPINETANWKTYQNANYKFEVKYPENFFVTWEGTWGKEGSVDSQHVIDLSEYEVAPGRQGAGIRMIISNFSGDLHKYVEEISNQPDEFGTDKTEIPITETKIGDVMAYKFLNNLYFVKNGKLYSINNGIIDVNLFNQILSTFKFIK